MGDIGLFGIMLTIEMFCIGEMGLIGIGDSGLTPIGEIGLTFIGAIGAIGDTGRTKGFGPPMLTGTTLEV